MKIVCEACQAKYSISDDKVRGKTFKIRCKKCSHVIVVRGMADDGVTVAVDQSGGAPSSVETAWHVVIEGEQVGPLPESDVRARVVRGDLSGDTFIWKEGMADWVKVVTLPEFADVVSIAPAADEGEESYPAFGAPSATTIYPAGTAETAFAGSAQSDADAFSAPTAVAPSAVTSDLFAAVGSPPAADLFGTAAASPSPGGLFASAASPDSRPASASFGFGNSGSGLDSSRPGNNGAGAPAGGLTGQRHENSVLFSLSNLEQLGSSAPAPVARPAPGSAPTTEGSGLIDIRAMAAMTLGGGPGAGSSPSPARDHGRGPGDLPAFSAPNFSPVAPVLLPLAPQRGPAKWVYALLGVAVLAVVGLSVAIVSKGMFSAPPPPAPAVVAPTPAVAPPPVATAPRVTPPPVTPPAPAEEKLPPRESVAGEKAAERTSEKGTERSASDRESRHDRGRKDRKGSASSSHASADKGTSVAAAVEKPSAPEKAAPAEKAPAKGSIDDLLAGALNNKPSRASARAKAEDEEPKETKKAVTAEPLSRDEVVKGMQGIRGKVKECYNQYKVPGSAMLNVVVAPSGRVSSAKVSGKFAGTPSGNCVEAAAKSAHFPPSAGLPFDWPAMLN